MPNVTINIKNCGCCPGGIHTPETGQGGFSQWDGLGDPESVSGPPDGYSTPSGTLADRQCKMAVWLYSWLSGAVDYLGNTITGGYIITTVRLVTKNALLSAISPPIVGALTVILGLIITPGPGPNDVIAGILAGFITASLISHVERINTTFVTQPLFVSALSIIENHQDAIICHLSTAANATEAHDKLYTQFTEIGLSLEQREVIMAFMPNHFFTMLFFTANWWPSFDDDVLVGIATTCCGDYVDGATITPGSVKSCQASNYIIDALINVLNLTAEAMNTSFYDVNPFYNDKSDIFNNLKSDINPPQKTKDLATNWTTYLTAVTELFYAQVIFGNSLIVDPGFSGLASHIIDNKVDLVDDIQLEPDQTAAFTLLYSDLSAWIDANVTSSDYQVWMKTSIAALITPTNRADFMDLLFIEDSGLVGYAYSQCQEIALDFVFQTSGSSPYNVIVIGDSASAAGDANGWITLPQTNFYFTPAADGVATSFTAEFYRNSPTNWLVGEIKNISSPYLAIYGTGGAWVERTFVINLYFQAGVQRNFLISPLGGNGFQIRNIRIS